MPLASTFFQAGVGAVPSVVTKTSPLLWPTQIIEDSPGATATALMGTPVLVLIAVHLGPFVDVLGVLGSLVCHTDIPPAKIRLALLGSRTNGAIKLACWLLASGIWYGN